MINDVIMSVGCRGLKILYMFIIQMLKCLENVRMQFYSFIIDKGIVFIQFDRDISISGDESCIRYC